MLKIADRRYTFTEWLETYPKSTTRRFYYSGLRKFLKSVYNSSDSTELLAERYASESDARDNLRDLENFITYTQDVNRNGRVAPGNSLRGYLAAVYGFFENCCGIEVPVKLRKNILKRVKGFRAKTREDVFTKDTAAQTGALA